MAVCSILPDRFDRGAINDYDGDRTVVLGLTSSYNLSTFWYVTVSEEDAFVFGVRTFHGPEFSGSEFPAHSSPISTVAGRNRRLCIDLVQDDRFF